MSHQTTFTCDSCRTQQTTPDRYDHPYWQPRTPEGWRYFVHEAVQCTACPECWGRFDDFVRSMFAICYSGNYGTPR